MQYSPKLKVAMEEIKAILKKHDIAGVISLHTPGHGEFFMGIEPTYSCAKLMPNGVHFKAKKEDYNNELKRHTDMRDTVNMITILTDLTAKNAYNLIGVSEELNKLIPNDSTKGGFTDHITQNN